MAPPAVLSTSNYHSGVDREQLGSMNSNLKNPILLGYHIPQVHQYLFIAADSLSRHAGSRPKPLRSEI